MQFFHPILATNEDPTGKIVIFVIAAIIWAIRSIASAINKKSQQSAARQEKGELPIDLTPRMEAPRPPVQKQPVANRPAQRRGATPPPPLPVQVPRPVVPPGIFVGGNVFARPRQAGQTMGGTAPAKPAIAAVAQAVSTPSPKSVASVSKRSGFARMLRPEILRTQIIVAELLGKPLALRDDPHL